MRVQKRHIMCALGICASLGAAEALGQADLVTQRQPVLSPSIVPTGSWSPIATPNPGSETNAFIDGDEGPDGIYALLSYSSTPSTSDPDEIKVFRRSGAGSWEDLGAPAGDGGLPLLEYRSIAVAPDGTVWLGAEWFPDMQLGQNAAPAIAWRTPDGTWHGPEEIPVEPNTDFPPSRRFVDHTSLEVAPDGTVFYMGQIRNYSALLNDAMTPMVIRNDGSGWVEVGADDRIDDIDWPGGELGVGPFIRRGLAFSSDNLWGVGRHNQMLLEGTGAFIARYTGSTPIAVVEEGSLEPRTDPFSAADLFAIDANAPDDIWAVGESGDSVPLGLIVHWNGTEWTRFRVPPTVAPTSLVVTDNGTAWASGFFPGESIAYFDGSRWRLAPFAAPGDAGNINIQRMLEAPDGALYAIGSEDAGAASFAMELVPTPPCLADFAEPIGLLNFSDVSAFLFAFTSSDPSADFAPPFGVLGFTDVIAYLDAFAMGCDEPVAPGIVCPGSGACDAANGSPGCVDETCCEAVAAIDEFSGSVAWDWLSVEIAAQLGSCGFTSGDTCAQAHPVGVGVFQGSTTYKAIGDDVSSGGVDDLIDEWWAFTPPCDGPVTVSMLSGNDPATDATIAVFDACGGSEIAFANDTSFFLPEASFDAEAGRTYLVRVALEFGDWTDYSIEFRCDNTMLQGGDDCASAAPISEGSFLGTTVDNAGLELFSSDCVFIQNQIDEWFRYTATADGTLTVSTCNGPAAGPGTLDTDLAVFDACGGTELACNADAFCPTNASLSELTLQVSAGETYLIRVGGAFGTQGEYRLDVTLNP